jgi:hypothetical protein
MTGSLIRPKDRTLPRTSDAAVRLLGTRTVLNANALAQLAQVIRKGRLETIKVPE